MSNTVVFQNGCQLITLANVNTFFDQQSLFNHRIFRPNRTAFIFFGLQIKNNYDLYYVTIIIANNIPFVQNTLAKRFC